MQLSGNEAANANRMVRGRLVAARDHPGPPWTVPGPPWTVPGPHRTAPDRPGSPWTMPDRTDLLNGVRPSLAVFRRQYCAVRAVSAASARRRCHVVSVTNDTDK